MKKSITYIILIRPGYFIALVLILFSVISCNPTKYVPDGESLLNENHIKVNKEAIKNTELIPYIKQTPNKRIFGTRFHLGLYNLSNINKERWPHKWLRSIGEEPVIFDPTATTSSREQIKSYVSSKGYFDGKVMDTVLTAKRKSDVFYEVDLLRPYTIRNLTYEIADSNIKNLCFFDSVNCVIRRGKPYDVDMLQQERARFERFIRDHGFYGFTNDYISFYIDSTVGNRQVDIRYHVRDFSRLDASNRISTGPFAVYTVKNVYIYPDFVPKEALEGGEEYFRAMDTTFYRGYYFVTNRKKRDVKYDLIVQSIYLNAGSVYSVTGTEQTQAHLMSTKIYRLVNINYSDAKDNESLQGMELKLDCNIQLTLLIPQSYKVELEGTNQAGNLGGALNLIYQHKNLFHGAELFSMKLKGAYSAYKLADSSGIATLRSVQEYGIETSLKLPKFMVPFLKTEAFIKKFNPTTSLQVSYNYQSMPLYTRTIGNISFGYNWRSGLYSEHIVNPVQLSFVNVPSLDPLYKVWIETSTYQIHSYDNVLILGGGYSYIFNNQNIKNSRDYIFLRINAETAGNSLTLAELLTGGKKTEGNVKAADGTSVDTTKTYKILGQPFAQYVRTDFDFRYYYKFNDVSSIVYRGFFGIGIPYGNSKTIPFEKQFFGGGANGIRAWQIRSLGPGTYSPESKRFLNQTGDIKLEANVEYRFKLFWILEGALFLDAGNIWTYNYDVARKGSQFKINRFYKDFAVGTGTGFRFDFKFVIARVDIGMKLRDPLLGNGELVGPVKAPDTGSKWIFLNGPYKRNDFAVVFGIGYPF